MRATAKRTCLVNMMCLSHDCGEVFGRNYIKAGGLTTRRPQSANQIYAWEARSISMRTTRASPELVTSRGKAMRRPWTRSPVFRRT